MLFNSWEFLVLCIVTLALYYIPIRAAGKVWQVTVLLVASAFFYAWGTPSLLILLGCSCIFNAVAVERILFWKKADSERTARVWLFATVALNLGFLAFFKYAGFLIGQLPQGLLPEGLAGWISGIPLPVGISFYTFQGISLVVDIWRDDISPHTRDCLAQRGKSRIGSLRDTSFYISFFPQLVAGPIVKAHEFVDQIGAKLFSEIDWLTVRRSLVTGYFLKIFVADNLSEQTATLTLGAEHLASSAPFNLLPLLYGYSFQIFADFAGYSLIAIGLGALFGYKLPPNFNFPYLSTSITEFWRRWHLSLSSWLRDYLYIPLGGNRKGSGRTYFNLFLVMFLGGLWHGAAWKFALWGSLHGIFLAVERLAARRRTPDSRHQITDEISTSGLWSLASGVSAIRCLVTFHLVTLLWLTFMMPDMASIAAFFKGMSSGRTGFSGPPGFSLVFYGSAVVLYHAWGWFVENHHQMSLKLARAVGAADPWCDGFPGADQSGCAERIHLLPVLKSFSGKTEMRYLFPFLFCLGSCFGLQAFALRAVGGRTVKSESNFFSSLGRIQAGTEGRPEMMLLGSSITGRLPDRAQGFERFANMGCDGGSAVDALRAMHRGILPTAPLLVIEANTLVRALNPRPSEIGLAMTRPWFRVGTHLPLLSAYARPSAFLYSKLLAGKIGDFGDPAGGNDLRVTSAPVSPDHRNIMIEKDERRLVDELVPVIRKMEAKGTRVVVVWLPPARPENFPVPPWITALIAESGAEWWDLGNAADASLVSLTDGTHMSADSAARTVVSIRKGLANGVENAPK